MQDREEERDDDVERQFIDIRPPDGHGLSFQLSDPAFRILICRYPIGPVYLVISAVKMLLALAALGFTVAQLTLYQSPTNHSSADNSSNGSINVSTGKQSSYESWVSSIFYFEPTWWVRLAYVRLFVIIVAICGIVVGLYGLWRQHRICVTLAATSTALIVAFLLSYLIMLAWYAVKYDDYFVFCFGGLALFSLLLINVLDLHADVVLYRYLRAIESFLHEVGQRWPNAYQEASEAAKQRKGSDKWLVFRRRFAWRYLALEELCRTLPLEMSSLDSSRWRSRLRDIEENEAEEAE